MLRKIYDSFLTLAYPQACHNCQRSVERSSDGVACHECWAKTRIFSGRETLCARCSAYLNDKPPDRPAFCHRCDDHFYDEARAVGVYEHALAASVLHLKKEPFVAARLGRLLAAAFENSPFQETDLIMPVPLGKRRHLERGFNQAAILAGILARHARLPVDEKSLARKIDSPANRAAMDSRAREKSVQNAFEIKRSNFVKNRKILLVDDVFTSGATVSSCAKVLKKNGAGRVSVLTVARAV